MDLTNSLWQRTATQPDPPSSTLPQRVDIAIIGAGITGAACALRLAGKASVTVIEGRSCAAAATGRNAGFILTGLAESYYRMRIEMGREKTKRLWSFSRQNGQRVRTLIHDHSIECDYTPQGSLALAAWESEARELRESCDMLVADGFDAEWFEMQELGDFFPEGIPGGFHGARRSPNDAMLQPVDYCRGILTRATEKGVTYCSSTEVTGIDRNGDATMSVRTGNGTVIAERVVLTTNARLPDVHPFFKPNKVFAVRGQMLSTKPVSTLFKGCMTANHGYEYWRQTPDGRVVLGGFRWRSNDYELGVADESTTRDVQLAAEEFLHSHFPDFNWEVEYRWGGVMGFSADGLPFIGPLPGHSDLIAAGGFTGYGMGFGTLAGEAAADLALHGRTDTDVELFNPARFLR